MKQNFILGRLSEIMGWNTSTATSQFDWLRLMSAMKYDGYHDFLAGARFIESLADWLQQFDQPERAAAYDFVRNRLVYISAAEMNHLVELFYPETVQWRIEEAVASRLKIPKYLVWATNESKAMYRRILRQTLFIELSDGARIDVFRRANTGVISNEQVLTAPRMNTQKWEEILKDLRKDIGDENAQFAFVFLIDDFIASGTTLLRSEEGVWKGKLPKFWDDVQGVLPTHFEKDWRLCVHHYLASHQATGAVSERQGQILKERGKDKWFDNVSFSFGAELSEDLPLSADRDAEFLALTQKYYDSSIETKHTQLGGTDAKLGFSACALPLVLEHNTPNNSVALLWADTNGGPECHAMRPLFRRRQRHAGEWNYG